MRNAILFGWTLLAATSAWAQPTPNPSMASGPVDIRSERLTVNQKTQKAIFSGNVVAIQGALTVKCRTLTVEYASAEEPQHQAGEIKLMVFSGEVSIDQKGRNGHCETAIYDRAQGNIVCTGDPWVTEGPNRIHGQRIDYLLDSNEVKVDQPRAVLVLPEDRVSKQGGKEKGKKGGKKK